METIDKPRVYISYTWRTPGMKERVFEFAEGFRAVGVDSRIDLYYAKSLHGFVPPDALPGDDRPAWMIWQEDQIRNADFVLLVCSREYAASPERSGAWWDVHFMVEDFESGRVERRKFIPIGFGSYSQNSQYTPPFLEGAHYYDLSSNEGFGFDDLLRRIRNEFQTRHSKQRHQLEKDMNEARPKVFVSHNNKDKPFVRRLVDELTKRNVHVWFDEREMAVGDSIVDGISSGLNEADYLLVVLSRNSVGSRWVKNELNAALMEEASSRDIVVLPAVIDDCEIPVLLKDRIYADFRKSFEDGLNSLLRVFEHEAESPRSSEPKHAAVFQATDCRTNLGGLKLAELRRRITKRLSRDEVSVVWFDVFDSKMDNDMPNRTLVECVIELLDRARNRNKLAAVVESLCEERADLANP